MQQVLYDFIPIEGNTKCIPFRETPSLLILTLKTSSDFEQNLSLKLVSLFT